MKIFEHSLFVGGVMVLIASDRQQWDWLAYNGRMLYFG